MQWSLVVFIVMGLWSSTGGQLCDYRFIGEKKTWKEAQKYCRTNHTDLATVSNKGDMQRLQQFNQSGAWIGLQRDWRWSLPGVEFRDSNSKWGPGQPNNYNNDENCVVVMKDGWHDYPCDYYFKFICYDERNKTSGQRFYVSTSKMTWPNAQNYCRTHHTDLISGVQQLEDFKTDPQNNGETFWIGLFRDWSWSDGSSFSFRLWDEHKLDPKKTCAMTTSGGFWSSDDCSKPKTFFCYDDSVILIKENLTWVEALYYCRDHHGDLVSITNQDQQLWVQERAKVAATSYVWLGLRYTCTLGFWFWVSDETVEYTKWDPSETKGGNCDMSGAMDRGGGHKWVKKIDNKNQFNFICSKNSPPQCLWSSTGGQLCDYRFIGQNKTWKEAQKYCRTYHTDLATVSNKGDMQRLQQFNQSGAWIGLQIDWRWSLPGVEFNDRKWAPGQPNNLNNQENCVVVSNDGWHDYPCDYYFKFICYDERNKTSGNRCLVINYVMTWRDAQTYCRTNHTDLISGVQQLEDFRTDPQNNKGPFWIGLFRDWSWSDGSSFSFRPWDEHKLDPKKTCAMTTSGGSWRSDDCSKPKTFFCYGAGTTEHLPPWLIGIIAVSGFLFIVFIVFIVFLVKKARRTSAVETPGQEEEEDHTYEVPDMIRTKEEENAYANLGMDGPEDKVTSM